MKALSDYLLVGAGGFFGAIARYGVARLCAAWLGIGFPWGTFAVNISGSFLLGFIATLAGERLLSAAEPVRLAIAIGFIGAYTTFSTFEFETSGMAAQGKWLLVFVNLLGSVLLGFLAVRLGIVCARIHQ